MKLTDFNRIIKCVRRSCKKHHMELFGFTAGNLEVMFGMKQRGNKPDVDAMTMLAKDVTQEIERDGMHVQTYPIDCAGSSLYYLSVEQRFEAQRGRRIKCSRNEDMI